VLAWRDKPVTPAQIGQQLRALRAHRQRPAFGNRLRITPS